MHKDSGFHLDSLSLMDGGSKCMHALAPALLVSPCPPNPLLRASLHPPPGTALPLHARADYCYSADGSQLERCIAEVTNTPWGERVTFCFRSGWHQFLLLSAAPAGLGWRLGHAAWCWGASHAAWAPALCQFAVQGWVH